MMIITNDDTYAHHNCDYDSHDDDDNDDDNNNIDDSDDNNNNTDYDRLVIMQDRSIVICSYYLLIINYCSNRKILTIIIITIINTIIVIIIMITIVHDYYCHNHQKHNHHHGHHHLATYLSLIFLLHYQLRGHSRSSTSDPLRHHSHRQPYNLPSHEMMMVKQNMIFRSTNIYYDQQHDISMVRTLLHLYDDGDKNEDKYDHDRLKYKFWYQW